MDEYDSDSIVDEYDRNVMERLDEGEEISNVVENVVPIRTWDMPMFSNIDAWKDNEPVDEYLGELSNYSRAARHDISVGAKFDSKEDAIYAVQKFSILNRVEYRVKESEKKFMVLECREGKDNCPWRIRVSCLKKRGDWVVTKYQAEHTCQNSMLKDNVHMCVSFIAMEVSGVISAQLRVSAGEIRARIHKDYGYEISYLKAWKAKHKALEIVFGKWDESFQNLPRLMQRIEDTNPGSIVIWDRAQLDDDSGKCVVNRVFWAFKPSIEAYKHCRPILSIDGTHLYGRYNGKLLVACGLDANNHVLPLAFALVESESNSSWKWFMRCIREGVTDRDGLCVLSDRHKGILSAMRDPDWSPPRAYHRYCVRHFVSNFSTKVRDGDLKRRLSILAYERQKRKFDAGFDELVALLHSKPNARDWLVGHDRKLWSLAYDEGGVRYGSMTTNASECFNRILLGGRDLPISALVLFTFHQTNAWFCERKEKYRDGQVFSPKIATKLDTLAERAYFHQVRVFNFEQGLFEVTTAIKRHVRTVNISEHYCSCGKWMLYKYPCSHALAVCKNMRIGHEDLVDPYFRLDAYFQTWYPYFLPLGDSGEWRDYSGPIHTPNPVFMRCASGRPPTNRRHNEMDQSQHRSSSQSQTQASSSQPRVPRVQRCKICGELGHNRRSCSARATE